MLGTLSAKHELALAALDPDSKVKAVDMVSGIEELKRRLEVLLGAKPDAPIESQKSEGKENSNSLLRRDRMANAGGQLIGAAFAFIGEMFSQKEARRKTFRCRRLSSSVFPSAWKRMKKAN